MLDSGTISVGRLAWLGRSFGYSYGRKDGDGHGGGDGNGSGGYGIGCWDWGGNGSGYGYSDGNGCGTGSNTSHPLHTLTHGRYITFPVYPDPRTEAKQRTT